jgi:hypothetical protein
MYIKSHIDLLAEEASPYSATDPEAETLETLDLTMAYTGDETRDGGQTPGPFEEMRRRMAGLGAESDSEVTGKKKRKRKEKKRQWVWTIGVNEDESDGGDQTLLNTARPEPPTPADQILQTAILEQSNNAEEESVKASLHQPEQAGHTSLPSQLARSEPLEHPATPEDSYQETIDLGPCGTDLTTATRPPENFWNIKIDTIKIDFNRDTEMTDRPDT